MTEYTFADMALIAATESNDEYLGCSDGGCVVERPKGTGMEFAAGGTYRITNGGCKCLMDMHIDDRVRVRKAFARLRAELTTSERQRERLALAEIGPCEEIRAVQVEVNAIVAWLNGMKVRNLSHPHDLAACIEAGDHRKEADDGK